MGFRKVNRTLAVSVLAAISLLIFGVLALNVRSPGLLQFDVEITRTVQKPHNTSLDFLAYFFTFFGNEAPMALVCLIASLHLKRLRRPRAAGFILLTLLSIPLNYGIKLMFHRPRPTASLVRVLFPTTDSSFPSGHAMCSIVVYGFLAFLGWEYLQDTGRRRFWTAVLAALPIGVSLSRIYIGVHWFSDVIGGYYLGLAILLVLIQCYSKTVRGPIPPFKQQS